MKWIAFPFLFVLDLVLIFFVLPFALAKNWLYASLGYVPYFLLGLVYTTILPYSLVFDKKFMIHDAINRMMAKILGYSGKNTMSYEIGYKITSETISVSDWLLCFHCRLLATYDVNRWHCTPSCRSLI